MTQQRCECNQMIASIECWPQTARHRTGSLHGVTGEAQYQYFMYTNYGNHNQAGINAQTPSWLLWEASSHMLQLMREVCSYIYPPLSTVRYSVIQLSELEQCRVKKLPQGFNTAALDSNPGYCSRESEALPRSNCAAQVRRLPKLT